MTAPRRWWVAVAAAAGLLGGAASTVSCGADDYRSLALGTCLPDGARVEGEREPAPPTVPCASPHRYEVYRVGPLGLDGAYPGVEAVDRASERVCFDDFEAAVGIAPADLDEGVDQVIIAPTESSWDGGDREVECLLRFGSDRAGRYARTR